MNVVIRAGGSGQRLWPLSRKSTPKQFHAIISEKTLFRETIDRALGIVDNPSDLFVSCSEETLEMVASGAPEVSYENIIQEPQSKNTGPAMCLEAAVLETRLSPQSIVLSIPSDDYVGKADEFIIAMAHAASFLEIHPQWLITPCVKAQGVDTGYSYAKSGANIINEGATSFSTLSEMVEKPTRERCASLISSGQYAVHVGMYMYQLDSMIARWEQSNPDLLRVCRRVARDLPQSTDKYNEIIPSSFESLITRATPHVAMCVIENIEWSDVGKWHVVKKLLGNGEENVTRGSVWSRDTKDCLIYANGDKAVVTIGLNDTIVVDTKDALFVSKADRSHEIKELLSEIDKKYI